MRKFMFMTVAAVALAIVASFTESANAQVVVSTPGFYGAYGYPYAYNTYPYYGVTTPYVGVGVGTYPYYSGYYYPGYYGGTRWNRGYRGGWGRGWCGGRGRR